ncbi:MAG: hypothetical protein JSR76_08535 [Verrucomicrobia bacterium]|nr:hypothetical protein [Verrucomicrobiota bacterium]
MKKVAVFFLLFTGFVGFFVARNYIGEQFFPRTISSQFVDIVEEVREIRFPLFYGRAFNPGAVSLNEGYLLSFRSNANGFLSYLQHYLLGKRHIYLNFMLLDESFSQKSKIVSFKDAGQDARLITVGENIYAIYNDETIEGGKSVRRIYMARVGVKGEEITLEPALKLIFPETEAFAKRGLIHLDREKNWSPFVHENELYFVYLITPHVVLKADVTTGQCLELSETALEKFWSYNTPYGGTPAIATEGEYLAFFHASTATENRWQKKLERGGYYFGAYTFSETFPFQVLRRTTFPLYPSKLPWQRRKIVYPMGLIEKKDHYMVFAGVSDKKVYLFRISKEKLRAVLEPV